MFPLQPLPPALHYKPATVAVFFFVALLTSADLTGQHVFHRNKARHYKDRYRSQMNYYANACDILERKRYSKPKSNPKISSEKLRYRPMAEMDPPGYVRTYNVQPVHNVKEEAEESAEIVIQLREDQVLAENNLTVPTSKKHEEIRNNVLQTLKNKSDSEPIELAPLYFNFNQDELAMMDTEPFLYAVEYALQGRHILIEGHSDSQGADTYNVQLSIKRVQKIRKLMHDMGVPDDRISVVGYGEEHASVTPAKDDHQKFRRVDFKVF